MNWLPHKPPCFTILRATSSRDAVRMRQCAPWSYLHSTSRDDLLPNRYRYRMRTTIGSHAGESTHTEMQFYRSTPNGRRWRLRALLATPTNHAAVYTTKARLYTLRCLCTKARLYMLWCLCAKHDSICCSAYAPKHNSTLRCLPPKRYEPCCGDYTPMLYRYAAVTTPKLYEIRTEVSTALAPKYCGRRCLTAPKDAEAVTITEAGLLRSP